MMPDELTGTVRFTDVLTTASAIASLLGADEITASTMLQAIDVLLGRLAWDAVGRRVSPLVPRPPGGPRVSDPVIATVQRWWVELGEDPFAELGGQRLERFALDLLAE